MSDYGGDYGDYDAYDDGYDGDDGGDYGGYDDGGDDGYHVGGDDAADYVDCEESGEGDDYSDGGHGYDDVVQNSDHGTLDVDVAGDEEEEHEDEEESDGAGSDPESRPRGDYNYNYSRSDHEYADDDRGGSGYRERSPRGVRGRAATLHVDGASRGNPGHSSIGAVLTDHVGRVISEVSEYIGPNHTNNYAEYKALVRGLEIARDMGIDRISVRTDSQLVRDQVTGSCRTNRGLQALRDEAQSLLNDFAQSSITHVPRGRNAAADQLANRALDERLGRRR